MSNIVKASEVNLEALIEMALDLWPNNEYEEFKSEWSYLMGHLDNKILLAEEDSGEYVGFIHLSIRNDYVEGSLTSPVGYIEGIYIKQDYRNKGIAKELFDEGVKWVKSKGCTELGSDCEIENQENCDFHLNMGFEMANKITCFIKNI